jgi:hypothetical protein
MIKVMRRRFFTLLETLIAMTMTVIVLTTLTFFYRQINELNTQAEILQKEGFRLRYIESRFSKIFPLAVPAGTRTPDFFFFTVSDPGSVFAQSSPISLIFSFNNGVDLSKLFSNNVIARIFLDIKGRLCMATWPSQTRWMPGANVPMKLEVLLEEVESLKFLFFVAPDKKWQLDQTNSSTPPTTPPANTPMQTVITVNPSPEGSWIQEWSQDYNQLPALIKLEVVRKGKTDYFTFPLSKCKRQPVYNQ